MAQDGKRDEALALYKQANEIKPGQPESVLPWAVMLFQNHQENEGEKLLLDFVAKQKTIPGAYDLLYTLYNRDKRTQDAEKILRAKADAMPDHPEFRVQLAAHYFINQRRDEMEKECADLLALLG